MTYVERELEHSLEPFLNRKEALSIVGPRQAGKTTFIKHLEARFRAAGKRARFFTFENSADLALFQNSLEDFKKLIAPYDCVLIDEFQYSKDGGKKLKYLYDTTAIKFIVSGSSSLELTFQTGKYMVGRLLDFILWPFSFREFLSAREPELHALVLATGAPADILQFDFSKHLGAEANRRLASALERYAVHGGYPAVALCAIPDQQEKLLQGIVENYLLYDIKDLLRLPSADELRLIARLLAAQIGGLVKYDELARSSRLSYRQVVRHLGILDKTFIISLLRPYFTNRRTELTKNPKSYFVDTGVRNFFVSDFRAAEQRPDIGALMENYARSALGRLGLAGEIKYWRTKSKAEVDFVVEREQNVYPIEVKYSSAKNIGKSFYSFMEKFNPPTGIILTKDYVGQERIKNTLVKFIPLSYL